MVEELKNEGEQLTTREKRYLDNLKKIYQKYTEDTNFVDVMWQNLNNEERSFLINNEKSMATFATLTSQGPTAEVRRLLTQVGMLVSAFTSNRTPEYGNQAYIKQKLTTPIGQPTADQAEALKNMLMYLAGRREPKN